MILTRAMDLERNIYRTIFPERSMNYNRTISDRLTVTARGVLVPAAFLLIIFSLMNTTLNGQTIDRSVRPAADPFPTAAFPDFETFTLSNGVKVFFVHDTRPLVTIRILFNGGTITDGDLPGLSDAVADLMTKGAGKLSAQEFASQIDFLGGDISADNTSDAITVRASGLKSHFAEIMRLLSEAVLHPTYSDDELEKYQSMQVDGLRASKKQSDFLANYAVNRLIYGDNPLGHLPTEESIRTIDDDDLKAYHKRHFIPANASIAVVGDYTQVELKALLEKYLGTWSNNGQKKVEIRDRFNFTGQRIILVDRPTSVQSSIRVVGPGPLLNDVDRLKSTIMNSILGGGTGLSNRLTMNLRETHGWTYSPYSYFNSNRYSGYFIAAADVRNEVTDSAMREMFSEIGKLSQEEVSSDELNLNIQSAVGSYLMSLANPSVTVARVQNIDFYGLPADYYDRLVGEYSATTSADVLASAQKYFNVQNMSVVVVGKGSDIREKLESFGTIEVWNEDLEPVREISATDLSITASEVWAKMLDSQGGEAALKQVKTVDMVGEAALEAGGQLIEGEFRRVRSYPSKEYLNLSINYGGQMMSMYRSFNNGSSLVILQPTGPVEQSDDEMKKAIAGSHINPEVWYRELGGKIVLRGMKEVDNVNTYVVELTLPGATAQTYYVDADDFHLVQKEQDGTMEYYTDWVDVGNGIKQPTTMILVTPDVTINVSKIEYTINGPVDDKIFDAP